MQRQLDTIAVIKRAVDGGKLTPAEALDALDLMGGVEVALLVHTHFAYTVFECAREISLKAAANADA